MCARARQSRCSTATAETASHPVALLSLPASLSWCRTQRSPVRRRRTRFVLAAVVSRLAAFAPIVALLYSRVAKPLQDSCQSAFPRWTISLSFSRCWTSGHPVRNRGFALLRQFRTILSRHKFAQMLFRLTNRWSAAVTDKVHRRGVGALSSHVRRSVRTSRRCFDFYCNGERHECRDGPACVTNPKVQFSAAAALRSPID
jgi:hypothetical protein